MSLRTYTRLVALSLVLASASATLAQSTAFTYQGRLLQGDEPANGLFDFEFRAFDDPSGGSQVGLVSTHLNTQLEQGQLQLVVDFGPGVFVGDPLWIEISMRPAGPGAYDVLSPRQLVTPAPLAINADTVDGLDSTELQGQTGPAGPPGPVGAPGIDGLDGTAVLHGAGAPVPGEGIDGDFFIDTSATTLWGPKTGGSWVGSGPVALVGPTGDQGPAGAAGPAGPQGDPGATGPSGPAGAAGPAGPPGLDGQTVLSGSGVPSDAIGSDGDFFVDTTGVALWGPKAGGTWTGSGPTQLVGPQGPAGATGPQGDAGATGAQGPAGPQGDPGPPGATGAAGPQGPTGPQGDPGATGAQGPAGPQGDAGVAGAEGPAGPQGDPGPPGAAGAQGPQGPPGATGAQGPAGPQGLQGDQGPAGPAGPSGTPGGGTNRVIRWNVFSTYDQNSGWLAANQADLFGGVTPANWTDNNAQAHQISSDKDVLRTLLTEKSYPGNNMLLYAETWGYYSSTNGRVVVALVRIRNTTLAPIDWTVRFHHTCYQNWSELASIAINGVSHWSSAPPAPNCSSQIPLNTTISIPADRTSSVIFVSTSSTPTGATGSTRSTLMAFSNNTFLLPAGLELVDDFETATGGWEQ